MHRNPTNPSANGAHEAAPRLRDPINHLDQIRADYWSGRTISDLAEQWAVTLLTITTWVYSGDPAGDGPASKVFD